MTTTRTLFQELQERGFVYQYSCENLEEALETKRTVYLGTDPTADSIHVGNLVMYMLGRHLADHGHKIILLIGGATGLIGDPSGKSAEREFHTTDVVASYAKSLMKQVEVVTGVKQIKVVNNLDWFKTMSFLEFLRDVGKHFTVNTMIKKESVERRLQSESGISYTEFSYSLLQGYDFYHLNQTMGVDMQIGGSDQWGNIIAGVELCRRKAQKEVLGLTHPLIVDEKTGKKFGKSEGNAVWLDAQKTSPYDFYQFWLNTDDEAVIKLMKIFTLLSLEEIETYVTRVTEQPEEREAQKKLAYEVTAFVHGTEIADGVTKVSQILFGNQGLDGLSKVEQKLLLEAAPSFQVTGDIEIITLLVDSGLASSRREAKEFLQSGAVTINDEKITALDATVTKREVKSLAMLRRGKKKTCVLYA